MFDNIKGAIYKNPPYVKFITHSLLIKLHIPSLTANCCLLLLPFGVKYHI